MLVTTLTTACSFLSNVVSPIQAVADFGLFMGVIVIMNYIIVMTWWAFIKLNLNVRMCTCYSLCLRHL